MDQVIERLINIENRAQSLVGDAKKFSENIDGIVDKNVNEIRKNIEEHKAAKEQAIIQAEKSAADERIAKIRRHMEETEKKMRHIYEKNADSWVEQIFREIIDI